MFDVGGQRIERRKWIQCFNGEYIVPSLLQHVYTRIVRSTYNACVHMLSGSAVFMMLCVYGAVCVWCCVCTVLCVCIHACYDVSVCVHECMHV